MTANAEKTRAYYEELWNNRNLEVIEDWIDPSFVGRYTSVPDPVRGQAGFRRFAEELFEAFPDLTMTVVETIAQDDRVASRVELHGTHRGELLGFAATGLPVAATFLAIEHYVDGLVVAEWVNSDDLRLSRQIKALPDPGSRGERMVRRLHRMSTRRLRGG